MSKTFVCPALNLSKVCGTGCHVFSPIFTHFNSVLLRKQKRLQFADFCDKETAETT